MKPGAENGRPFYLVQRLYPNIRPGVVNPFGYGVLGDFALDYMGAAEYEWGALPESWIRFGDNYDDVITSIEEVDGVAIEALWIAHEGFHLFETIDTWVKGGCQGHDREYPFLNRFNTGKRDESLGSATLWWALNEDVFFAFAEDEAVDAFVEGLKKPDGLRKLRGSATAARSGKDRI